MKIFQRFILFTLRGLYSYKTGFLITCSILFVILVTKVYAYTDILPEDVYARVVAGDTLILLDVREVIEYQNGHIAEPAEQLPLTPVNMPWNSNVLQAEFTRLPNEVDIIVYCQSGGRSALASAFLETNGFTKIYNMLGGYGSWTFDTRDGSYGDHSGQWIRANDPLPIEIICTGSGDTSKIIFPSSALPVPDSMFVELHFASNYMFVPPDVPQSDMDGLFRVTALDPFGLTLFDADSLVLIDTTEIIIIPDFNSNIVFNPALKIYVPGEGWRIVESNYVIPAFYRNETILRKWYNGEGWFTTSVKLSYIASKEFKVQAYPNPFNSSTKIWYSIPQSSKIVIKVFDVLGKEIELLVSEEKPTGTYELMWNARTLPSGIYFYQLNSGSFVQTKKMVLVK